jgi:hypothetical protein
MRIVAVEGDRSDHEQADDDAPNARENSVNA